jgi:4-carboxymuconolactone decarboxylase
MNKSAIPLDLPVVAAVPVPKAKLPVFTQTPTQLELESATGGAGSSNNSGVQEVVLLGNPSNPGPYVELLEIAPHTTGQAHHHTGDRIGTVLKGTLRLGFGPKFDESSLVPLPVGSIYTEPSGVAHFAQTGDEAVIVQITGYGPTSTVNENPTDDPALTQNAPKEKRTPYHPTFGRYAEIPLDQMTGEQRKGYQYVMRERNRCPGPYKIWVENPPIMDLMVPLGAFYTNQSSTKQSSLNDTEIKIATVMIVAKWGSAFAISEQELFAEEKSGYSTADIPAEKVERMIIGLPVSFDDPRQQAIYDVSTALVNSRYVPKGLYDRAVKLLGNNGVTDLTVLIGYFTAVALTLMFHDVPSYAEGMKR